MEEREKAKAFRKFCFLFIFINKNLYICFFFLFLFCFLLILINKNLYICFFLFIFCFLFTLKTWSYKTIPSVQDWSRGWRKWRSSSLRLFLKKVFLKAGLSPTPPCLEQISPKYLYLHICKCSLAAKGLHLPISSLLGFFSQRLFLFLHGVFSLILIKVFVSTAGNVNCAAGNLDIYFKRGKNSLAELLSSAMHRGTL